MKTRQFPARRIVAIASVLGGSALAGCSSTSGESPLNGEIAVRPSISHAVRLHDAAIQSLIHAGLSGDNQAMLFVPHTEQEYARQVETFNKAGRVTDEYVEFERYFQNSLANWRGLMADALALSGQYRSIGDRDREAEMIESLRNIAEANAAEERTIAGQLVARDLLKTIDETVETRSRFDP